VFAKPSFVFIGKNPCPKGKLNTATPFSGLALSVPNNYFLFFKIHFGSKKKKHLIYGIFAIHRTKRNPRFPLIFFVFSPPF
jgi:hypothetical protein